MNERIEAFLRDVQELEGVDAASIRDGVRSYLAVYENLVRDTETEQNKRDKALRAWHVLCRKRIADEVAKHAGTPVAEHWKLVLSVIDSAALSH
jgi:hypothetical protein